MKLVVALVCWLACGQPARPAEVRPVAVARFDAAPVDPDISVYETESLGALGPGVGEREVIAQLGAPTTRDQPVEEGATGDWVSAWTWPGATLSMAAEREAGPWTVRSVSIDAPSKLATKRGIRIGSARAEVERTYKRSPDDDASDPARYLVGSMYGGVLFALERDRVVAISIGPFAY